MRERAYARAYGRSDQRAEELPAFLFRYNWQRPHMGINRQTPVSRLGSSEDNLSMLHTSPEGKRPRIERFVRCTERDSFPRRRRRCLPSLACARACILERSARLADDRWRTG